MWHFTLVGRGWHYAVFAAVRNSRMHLSFSSWGCNFLRVDVTRNSGSKGSAIIQQKKASLPLIIALLCSFKRRESLTKIHRLLSLNAFQWLTIHLMDYLLMPHKCTRIKVNWISLEPNINQINWQSWLGNEARNGFGHDGSTCSLWRDSKWDISRGSKTSWNRSYLSKI